MISAILPALLLTPYLFFFNLTKCICIVLVYIFFFFLLAGRDELKERKKTPKKPNFWSFFFFAVVFRPPRGLEPVITSTAVYGLFNNLVLPLASGVRRTQSWVPGCHENRKVPSDGGRSGVRRGHSTAVVALTAPFKCLNGSIRSQWPGIERTHPPPYTLSNAMAYMYIIRGL